MSRDITTFWLWQWLKGDWHLVAWSYALQCLEDRRARLRYQGVCTCLEMRHVEDRRP